MASIKSAVAKTPKAGFGLLGWLWKYKFWILLILFTLPTIVQSVQYAMETQNPTYPFFQLATRIFVADSFLEHDVMLLSTDPVALIGMAKPETGIWLHFVYYWKFFINVIWQMMGNVWLIFFPLVLIHKFILGRNTSEKWKAWTYSLIIFLLYLFVAKTIILIHGIVTGNTIVILPEGLTVWYEYFILFKHVLPFHGLWSLLKFIILTAGGV